MKKIFAMLLALSLVFALAACGGNTIENTTVAPDTTVADTTVAPDTTVADTTVADTTVVDATETTVAAESTEATTEASKIPQTTEEIVAYYNAARNASKNDKINGTQKMALVGDITGDGAIGTFSGILTKAANSALSKNSTSVDVYPGRDSADLKASDVASATAKEDGKGNIVVDIKLKEQTDGSDGDEHNGGPVARGIGTLGSIEKALSELGATMTEGSDSVKLTYKDAYIKATINQETGKVVSGKVHHTVNVVIGDAKAKLGIKIHMENVKAKIDYTVTF